MNDEQYRLDIVGLEDDSMPEVTNLEDGSTYYTADTQKLYVLCKSTWYLQGESEETSDDTPAESEAKK